jgi:hypothetical protein
MTTNFSDLHDRIRKNKIETALKIDDLTKLDSEALVKIILSIDKQKEAIESVLAEQLKPRPSETVTINDSSENLESRVNVDDTQFLNLIVQALLNLEKPILNKNTEVDPAEIAAKIQAGDVYWLNQVVKFAIDGLYLNQAEAWSDDDMRLIEKMFCQDTNKVSMYMLIKVLGTTLTKLQEDNSETLAQHVGINLLVNKLFSVVSYYSGD